ncbi:hypothetical protein ACNHKD_08405 [Methylocystis sp. JAN1]|uniref:hypothetical protein n=1 Tax=Methylocystis sp. JAN1 TaxID=3397211 RepID=UPI003FA2EB32
MSIANKILLTEQPARRGFLRTLIAAPVAALATHKLILPAPALITPEDAAARTEFTDTPRAAQSVAEERL